MALPGIPSGGALGSAASAVSSPVVGALEAVTKALASIAEAAKAVLPVLAVMSDQFKELGEKLKNTFRVYVGEPLVAFVKGLNNAIKFALPTSVYEGIGDALKKVGKALGDTGKAFASVALAAPVAGAAVAALGLLMSGLVAKANPAVAEQFNLALNDLMAVVGQALMPVLQVVTQVVRLFADALMSFSGQLGSALGVIADALMPVFEALFEVFARVGKMVAEALTFVAPLIKLASDGIVQLFEWIAKAVKELLAMVGLEVSDSPVKKGASVGAAVRQAQHSDVSSVIAQAQRAAFSLGTASGSDPATTTAKNTGATIVAVNNLGKLIKELPGAVHTLFTDPGKAVENVREGMKNNADSDAMRMRIWVDQIMLDAQKAARGLDPNKFAGGLGTGERRRREKDGGGTVKAEPFAE